MAPPDRSPDLLRRLAFSAVVLVVVLGSVELGLRLVSGAPPPAVRVIRALGEHERYLEPGAEGWTPTYQHDTTPLPADDGRPLVAVMGGSSVHRGTPQLRRGAEFAAITGRRLRVRSANLGSPGFDSHDLVVLTEELLRAPPDGPENPDAIVIYTGHNDFGNARYQARYGTVRQGLQARAHSLLSRLQTYAWLSRALRPAQGLARHKGQSDDQSPLSEAAWEQAGEDLRRNLSRLVERTGAAGVPLAFVTPISNLVYRPRDTRCSPDRCVTEQFDAALAAGDAAGLRAARDGDRVSLRAPSWLRAHLLGLPAENSHVHVIDAETQLPRDPAADVPGRHLFVDPIHLSPEGHRLLGELIARELQAWLPERFPPRARRPR